MPILYSAYYTGVGRPYLIGIAGHSGAGKTTLAQLLAERLAGTPDAVLPVDAYYRDRSGVPRAEWASLDLESPAAIELPLLLDQLRKLAAGHAVERPVYDYSTHARRPEIVPFAPAGTVIVEGRLALYWDAVRSLLDTRVFIACDSNVCLDRRLARDLRERGRTAAEVRERWRNSVQPLYLRYVAPTRRYADLVVDGEEPAEAMAAAVLRVLAARPA